MDYSSLHNDEEHVSLCEALDRVLTKGVVLHGDIVISVADVDLVYLGVRLLLASTETAIRARALPPDRQLFPTTDRRRVLTEGEHGPH